jgi:hypothetical protein
MIGGSVSSPLGPASRPLETAPQLPPRSVRAAIGHGDLGDPDVVETEEPSPQRDRFVDAPRNSRQACHVEDVENLGRRLVRGMRVADAADDEAMEALRWGGDTLDDEELWRAVLAALDEAQDDGEFWALGDGLIDESVRTRPVLERRWREERLSNPKIAEVYRVMQDPTWNWTNPEGWGETPG